MSHASDCPDKDVDCSGCHSGPVTCYLDIATTTTTTSATTTTSEQDDEFGKIEK